MKAGDWLYSIDHDEPCQVVSVQDVWNEQTCMVWLPRNDAVVRLATERLRSLEDDLPHTLDQLSYICSAAKITDALARNVLVAPLEGTVIPLPHQLFALKRAMSGDQVRYLLADEVGLGKTIEAGLILRELKVRGLVKRTLVVAPAGLVNQWVSEMQVHFHEEFRPVLPGNFPAWRDLVGVDDRENLWRLHDQVVCSLDSVKPMEARRGWSNEQLARYNRERFDDLSAAGWDLVIVDEAHRIGGSTEQVARYKLGHGLSQASPYLLLLTATPHQGKTDSFRRIIGFLDAGVLPGDESVRRETVAPYVIRTEKRKAIDAAGAPLFKPRHTQIVAVAWDTSRHEQRALYEAVTEYIREGYNQALREKKTAIGFLMILMQRLVTSSTAAIRSALERRLEVLEMPAGQLSLFAEDVGEQWAELDGQERMESILKARLKGLKNERAEVELLLSAARRCEARSPDVKAEELLDRIRDLQREENKPSLKVLVFTEFVPTQAMLAEFLRQRGFTVTCLNGSLGLDERRKVQQEFAGDAQVLISTDAGGEGLNLQFCHVVVNYDLPWNPMKLEQRIGRVDRIGQKHVVRALNFALEDSVELRVREVLEEKLQRILDEFGVDKLADVLDSDEGGIEFEQLFVDAMLSPEDAEARATALADAIREKATEAQQGSALMGAVEQHDPADARRVAGHQMPFWTERMTVSYLRSQRDRGGDASSDRVGYHLRWPDGEEMRLAVFDRREAEAQGTHHLSLEDPRVRALTSRLPISAPGQPLVQVAVPGVSDKVAGVWSLWRIGIQTDDRQEQRWMPLFEADDGAVLAPTARVVWDRLIEQGPGVRIMGRPLGGEDARSAYENARRLAEEHGRGSYQELVAEHRARTERERRKTERVFSARRRAVERIGLPQVRAFRLAQLQDEEREWRSRMERADRALPVLTPLLVVRVAGAGDDAEVTR
jgi:SNF2 family DNA or RNA helicase